ncbi:MAG TPA: 4a-hydroxytetrahydrobiopterin dehydratase [Polyangia bacterium]|nr:4a-hydroxytetrahydrobiopterin dehydratase [Polyangia bacterium]
MAATKEPPAQQPPGQQPLTARRCVPCEGGTQPLDEQSTGKLLGQLKGWEKQTSGGRPPKESMPSKDAHPELHKTFRFDDFLAAMAFVDRMAALAEEEGHHPDFCVHYDQVDVTLWTHAVNGLSENDFILASKIDAILA